MKRSSEMHQKARASIWKKLAAWGFVSLCLLFCAYLYYERAWLGAASSPFDSICKARLHMLGTWNRRYLEEDGRLPRRLADLVSAGASYGKPMESPYPADWPDLASEGVPYTNCPGPGHPAYLLLPDGTIVCTNHLEHQRGWNLRFDRMAQIVGLDGDVQELSARETSRLLETIGPVRAEEASEAMAPPDATVQAPMHREDNP